MSSSTSNEVFHYTGRETIPKYVTVVNFDCSVINIEAQTFSECTQLKEVALNEGLQTIRKEAFAECISLERIILPSTVTDIRQQAFEGCKSLKELVLNEGLQMIGTSAFYNCKSLESVTLPSTVIENRNGAFYNCSSLKNVVLNEGLKTIRDKSFALCRSLESIAIPSTVTSISEEAFWSCYSLKEVTLNDGLKKIEMQAFNGCNSLSSITLPSTVTDIDQQAFNNCIRLSELVCIEGLPKVECNTFHNCPLLEKITFPNLSTRLDNIIQSGHVDAQNKIQQYINQGDIEWERGGIIYIPVDVTRRRRGWSLVQKHFRHIVNWIKYYEVKEATTLFELALWKAKIDQVEDDMYELDRNLCRVEVPGPVKDTILQYLGQKENYILIKTLTGQVMTMRFDVDPSDTIINIKLKIQQEKGIPSDQQLLACNGRLLQNERTLSDYNIQSGSTIDVMFMRR